MFTHDQQLVFLNDSAGTLVGGLVELSKLKKGREAKSILDVAHNVSYAVIKYDHCSHLFQVITFCLSENWLDTLRILGG